MNNSKEDNAATAPTMNTPKNDRLTLSDAEWQARLTPEQFRVTRQHGTERAFSGPWLMKNAPASFIVWPVISPYSNLIRNTNQVRAGRAFSSRFQRMRLSNMRIAVSECTESKSAAGAAIAISGMFFLMAPVLQANAIAPMAWHWISSRAIEIMLRSGWIRRL